MGRKGRTDGYFNTAYVLLYCIILCSVILYYIIYNYIINIIPALLRYTPRLDYKGKDVKSM